MYLPMSKLLAVSLAAAAEYQTAIPRSFERSPAPQQVIRELDEEDHKDEPY